MGNLNIKEIEKQFPDEWLAFEVLETDQLNRVVRGRLLAHSPNRKAVYEYLSQHPCSDWYVTFTGPRPKKGMHVVL
jgi:hypothetical protein